MSDHFDNGRFFNPNGADAQPFWKAPRMLFERYAPWPAQVPVVQRPAPPPTSGDEIVVTFIGHATFLIQTSAGNIITDPVFAQRAGPFGWAGPRRVRQPGVRFDDLPPIAYVLLSHNHYDHCDLETLRALQHRDHPRVVTLQGNATLLRSSGVTRIAELDWWQRMPAEMSAMRGAQTLDPAVTPGREIEITATQAQHFSARTPFDRNRALWGGFMITIDEQQIYFAGDSGYGPHFLEVGRRFPRIDLALIPIGAYEPRWFMKDIHMNPEEAVQAHMDVGARRSIGMHFGTFRLTTEGPNEPVAALGRARSAAGIDDAAFTTLDVGESARL
jgi:L-ascorbate metabolism protein UlaG (beta-lactamase superfamily)